MQNALRNTGERAGEGWAPGFTSRLLAGLTGRAGGKKLSGRTPNEPRTATAPHPLAYWRTENRQKLVAEALRLAVLTTKRPYVGRRPFAQYSSWKTLAVAVERARRTT